MEKIQLKKGNLYNQLTGKIDPNIVDSNQYDLEVKCNNGVKYYRVRFFESCFEAYPIKIEKFILPEFSRPCTIQEIKSFRKTNFYKYDFKYRKMIEKQKVQYNFEDYYYYFLKAYQKNSVKSQKIYDFCLPAIEQRKKLGVLSYDVSVEKVRNNYYIVFFKELVAKGYTQSDQALYVTYKKNDFLKQKITFENDVLSICEKEDYPVVLTEWLYLITGGNLELLKRISDQIKRAKNLKNAQILLRSEYAKIFQLDQDLMRKIHDYIESNSDDLEYQFKKL